MATSDEHLDLKIVSFNMHGFYQGAPVMEDIIDKYNPDLFMHASGTLAYICQSV